MPRFVILTHDHPFLHWDFLLEQEGGLRAWRLLKSPDTPGPIDAEPLPDHRIDYLDYEGPVSGGRGRVERWDRGTYTRLEETDQRIVVRLDGGRLRGTSAIRAARGAGEKWIFLFRLGSPGERSSRR